VRKSAKTEAPASPTMSLETPALKFDWKSFANAHSAWLAAFTQDEPIYRLPKAAISGLLVGNQGKKGFLEEYVDSETAFTTFCDASQAVGVWLGQPVQYPPLTPPLPLSAVPAEFADRFPWLKSKAARVATQTADEARHRLLGVPGWLLTEPSFLAAVSELKQCWKELPDDQRPFSLARPVRMMEQIPDSVPASTLQAAFFSQYERFLDRWGLLQMATWDLPQPQGPLLPSPVAADSPAYPRHGIHIVLPIHYPVQENDDLIREILKFQRAAARELNIDESFAGLPHCGSYGRMFEIIHLERSIRSRIRPGNSLHGHGAAMEHAIASSLHVTVAAVKKHRLAISACLRGKRSSVHGLRLPKPKRERRRRGRSRHRGRI
jgi:hypothetical protein